MEGQRELVALRAASKDGEPRGKLIEVDSTIPITVEGVEDVRQRERKVRLVVLGQNRPRNELAHNPVERWLVQGTVGRLVGEGAVQLLRGHRVEACLVVEALQVLDIRSSDLQGIATVRRQLELKHGLAGPVGGAAVVRRAHVSRCARCLVSDDIIFGRPLLEVKELEPWDDIEATCVVPLPKFLVRNGAVAAEIRTREHGLSQIDGGLVHHGLHLRDVNPLGQRVHRHQHGEEGTEVLPHLQAADEAIVIFIEHAESKGKLIALGALDQQREASKELAEVDDVVAVAIKREENVRQRERQELLVLPRQRRSRNESPHGAIERILVQNAILSLASELGVECRKLLLCQARSSNDALKVLDVRRRDGE
mmetsp:Transcript_136268/g.331216  ORF Transcript_136268/g.331216 Transcript_136268/m.331216 type:complete len:367 (-) Transcript_136268:1462-2562(-)